MTEFKKTWLPYKWELIVLLWFAFLFNMADRQAFNIVLPLLSKDLSLTPVQTGLVASVFLWVYSVLVPVGGFLGDIARRKWIVFASLVVWSIGTMLSGAATGLVGLILFRGIATGGGEAFYFPSASSLIGQHHKDTRAMAMSIHTTALYVGIIASGFVAGWIGEHYGWRSVFYVFGAVGVVLAATIAWRMKDTPQPPRSTGAGKVPLRELFHEIAGKPTVWAIWVSCCCFYFAQIGYLTWMPTYLHEKFSVSLTNAGFSSMFWQHAFAAVGVLVGGKVSDMLAKRRTTARIETEIAGLLCGAPFLFMIGWADSFWLCCLCLACWGLFRGIYDSNVYVVIFDVIAPRYRSSAMGVMLAVMFGAAAFAPVVLGWAKETVGLSTALSALSIAYVIGGAILVAARLFTFRKDYYDESAPAAQAMN
ncbi:MAG TPA: MFS transporter [Kiritimatiellia bacterium]|nr:MFS transporter [Kiritimatiellia bacterium]